MSHQLFSQKRIRKFFIPLIILFLATGFTACNDDEDKPATTERVSAFVMPDSLWYHSFVLDSAAIANDPRLMDNGNSYIKLLLKLSIDDIHGDTLDFGGYLYPAKNQGPHYGKGEAPITLQKSDTSYRKLRSRLILGNNDIAWRIVNPPGPPIGWKDVVTEMVGGVRRVKAGIGYLLFIPDDHAITGCTTCDGHLHFNIKLYNKSGAEIPFAGAGAGSSNPSPPAPPQ